jgi:hypothetical protein
MLHTTGEGSCNWGNAGQVALASTCGCQESRTPLACYRVLANLSDG